MKGKYEFMTYRLLDKLGAKMFFRKIMYGILGESCEMGQEMTLVKDINGS